MRFASKPLIYTFKGMWRTDVRRLWRPSGFIQFALGSLYADCPLKRIIQWKYRAYMERKNMQPELIRFSFYTQKGLKVFFPPRTVPISPWYKMVCFWYHIFCSFVRLSELLFVFIASELFLNVSCYSLITFWTFLIHHQYYLPCLFLLKHWLCPTALPLIVYISCCPLNVLQPPRHIWFLKFLLICHSLQLDLYCSSPWFTLFLICLSCWFGAA